MKMIIAAALLPIGLVLGTSLLISLVSRLVARLRKTEYLLYDFVIKIKG